MIRLLPIQTDRLELRRFCSDDLRAFQAYRHDPELAKYQGWTPTTDEEALTFLAEQSDQILGPEEQWLQVAVTRLDTQVLIGDVGLCVADSSNGVLKIGFTIARAHQHKGYATETVSALLARVFEHHVIQSVVAVTDTRNTASISLLQCLGFKLAGTDEAMFRGAPCTEHTFELTAPTWRE